MTHVSEEAALEAPLPGIREILHALPGLVAMIAVATIAVFAIHGSDSGAAKPAASQVAKPVPAEVATPPSISFVPEPPALPVQVFYLVRTQGQAREADWMEYSGALEAYDGGFAWPDRTHKVLFAGTEEEQRAAGQIMLEHMLLHGRFGLVEVIDCQPCTGRRLRPRARPRLRHSHATVNAPPVQYARTSDGVNIAYISIGAGQPVVFASNIFGDANFYRLGLLRHRELPDQLAAAGFRAILMDVRGMGSSDRSVPEAVWMRGPGTSKPSSAG